MPTDIANHLAGLAADHARLTKAVNALLRCYDYGKSTTAAEWADAVALARA